MAEAGRPPPAGPSTSWDPTGGRSLATRAARARSLRIGALLRGLVGAAAAAGLHLLGRLPVAAAVVLGIALATTLLGLVAPLGAYSGLLRVLGALGRAIGTVVAALLLVPVFVCFFVPFGLLTRRGKGDRLDRRLDRTARSYWTTRPPLPRDAAAYEKPY